MNKMICLFSSYLFVPELSVSFDLLPSFQYKPIDNFPISDFTIYVVDLKMIEIIPKRIILLLDFLGCTFVIC